MSKWILALLVCGNVLAAAQNLGGAFTIGQKLNPGVLKYLATQRCLTAPSQLNSCVRVRLRGVIYTLGYEPKRKTVNYIETHDAAFFTEGGLHVGSQLEEPVGSLTWMNDYGEVEASRTSDNWEPIITRGDLVTCADGSQFALSRETPRNSKPCRVQVLGFKKRGARRDTSASPNPQ
jgi:hypothetical protein